MPFLLPIIYIILPILTIVLHYVSIVNFYPPEMIGGIILGVIPGVFLFFWFMNQFITGSRIKFIERSLGFATVMQIHGVSTLGIALLLTVHGLLHGLGSITALIGFTVAMIFSFIVIVTVCFWLDTPLGRLPVIRTIKKFLDRHFDYRHYRILHNLNAVSAILVFIHISRTNLVEDSVYSATILRVYFALTFLPYLYHKAIKPILLRRKTFELREIIQENDKVTTLVFLQKKGKPFSYIEGQFGFFTFISGSLKGDEHPFSFSSTRNDDFISITIQNEGDFTQRLRSELKTGDLSVLEGPFGHFNIKALEQGDSPSKELTFIAGGIGITPFISMMQFLKDKKISYDLDFNWLYTSRSDAFFDRVLKIASTLTKKIHIFSRTRNQTFTQECISKQSSYKTRHYYICASKKLTRYLVSLLHSLGIPRKQIHYELFSW